MNRRALPLPGVARRRTRRATRPVLTPRALVLGALVVLFVVVLASPLHHYLGSRHDVSSAARQLRQDQQALKQLTAEHARWSDPGYVQQQARIRLQYAMPGDTVYTVVGPGHTSLLGRSAATSRATPRADTWSTRLWRSVQAAGG